MHETVWTQEEFLALVCAVKSDPRDQALAAWLVTVLLVPFPLTVGVVLLEPHLSASFTWSIVLGYAVAATAATVHVVYTYRRAPPRPVLECPRCATKLARPWRRVLIRFYLRRRQVEAGSSFSTISLLPSTLRFACPSCDLALTEVRFGSVVQ